MLRIDKAWATLRDGAELTETPLRDPERFLAAVSWATTSTDSRRSAIRLRDLALSHVRSTWKGSSQLRAIALSDIVPLNRRVFRTRAFSRWLRKTELSDHHLCEAVAEMAAGLVDADLGGHVFKKRVAVPGRGKRGSTRVLVGTNLWSRWFFVYGFEKNQRANIDDQTLIALQRYAALLLKFDAEALIEGMHRGELTEICHEEAQSAP